MKFNTKPWIEKYRPDNFDNIILDETNKSILNNILDTNIFPNLLLYGLPGTGKTTTIINLIKAYQKNNNQEHKELIIHLNASDDRGIDIIRSQIYNFTISSFMFSTGTKFVILDEVDYMTKNAQIALKYLIQQYNHSVKFCLICNYISKIDITLQNEFIKLKFNNLPKDKINELLMTISKTENINLQTTDIPKLINIYNYDIRSIINEIQNLSIQKKFHLINNDEVKILLSNIKTSSIIKSTNYIYEFLNKYNVEKYQLILNIFNYLIEINLNSELLNFIEIILHMDDYYADGFNEYFIKKLLTFIK